MAAPKFKTSDYSKLFKSSNEEQNLRDKQKIEALKERLNDILRSDSSARKAALILEQWLKTKN